MKTTIWLGAAMIALSACSAGQSASDADADANKAGAASTSDAPAGTRTFALDGFDGVEVAGPDNVTIRRGAAFAISAAGPQDVLDKLKLEVRDGKLRVGRVSRMTVSGWNAEGATITITMPALTNLALAGSGDITADALGGAEAEISLAGSGNISVAALDAQALTLNIAGSGDISASGTAQTVDASIAGSGDIDTTALTTRTADISIAGSGNIAMTVTGTADVSTIGSGDVTITGGATCSHSKIGSGSMNCS